MEKKSSHRTRNIVIAIVVIIVVLVIVVSALPKSNSPVSYTLVTSGTVYTIDAGQTDDSAFGLPPPTSAGQTITYTVQGSFTATNPVTVYFLNYDNYSAFTAGSSFTSYYSASNVTSGTIDISNVPVANAYYLVFDNTSPTNANVTITQALVASGTPKG